MRDRIRRSNIEEYDRKLEKFRLQNEEIGFGLLEMGLRMLEIAARFIKTLEAKDVLDPADLDLFLAIPNSIKALAAFSSSGSDLAADGLLIRQLIDKLKEDEN